MDSLLGLSDEELGRLIDRLTLYAARKMLRLTWRGAYIANGGIVPGGYEPHDFVLDAIRKMLDGTRVFNVEKYTTVEIAIRACIDSDINHLVESIANKELRLFAPHTRHDSNHVNEIASSEKNHIEVVIDGEWGKWFRQAARNELAGEEKLALILDCYENGITKPSEIANELHMTLSEVATLKKRLCRKLSKLNPRHTQVTERAAI